MAAARGRPRSESTDRAVMQAALELLAERGYDGLSMEAVAARAGVAKTTIYRRLPSRLDLIAAVAQHVAAPVRRPTTGVLRADLTALLGEVIAVLDEPLVRRVLPRILAEARDRTDLAQTLSRFWSSRRRLTLELLADGVARGELAADLDLDLAADSLYGPIYYRYLVTGAALDREMAAAIVDRALVGMSPRQG